MREREFWGSRLAFILAAAGSAIGLGNIWGFPTQVGQGGGAAFVLIYLFCILFICAPILIAELALGRGAGLSPVGAFNRFRPGSKWWLVGALGVISGVGIVSFYSVIGGWALAYIGVVVPVSAPVGFFDSIRSTSSDRHYSRYRRLATVLLIGAMHAT